MAWLSLAWFGFSRLGVGWGSGLKKKARVQFVQFRSQPCYTTVSERKTSLRSIHGLLILQLSVFQGIDYLGSLFDFS